MIIKLFEGLRDLVSINISVKELILSMLIVVVNYYYWNFKSSTSKISVALGGITPG